MLNALVDQSRLLQNFCFHRELMALTAPPAVPSTVDRQPMAIEAWLTNMCWILDLRNNLGKLFALEARIHGLAPRIGSIGTRSGFNSTNRDVFFSLVRVDSVT